MNNCQGPETCHRFVVCDGEKIAKRQADPFIVPVTQLLGTLIHLAYPQVLFLNRDKLHKLYLRHLAFKIYESQNTFGLG